MSGQREVSHFSEGVFHFSELGVSYFSLKLETPLQYGNTVNARSVRIPLECILVRYFRISLTSISISKEVVAVGVFAETEFAVSSDYCNLEREVYVL